MDYRTRSRQQATTTNDRDLQYAAAPALMVIFLYGQSV